MGSDNYQPVEYWTRRGKTFEAEAKAAHWWGAENEPLLDLLSKLEFSSVLEVGCGFARVGASLKSRWPKVKYTGMDVSPDLVAAGQRRLPTEEFICADLAQFYTDRVWDLVLSVSVLGHLRPEDVGDVVERMFRWAKFHVVAVEWDEVGGQTPYQYGHDYRKLFGKTAQKTQIGRLAMWHVRP